MFHAKSLEGAVRSDARVLGHLTDTCTCAMSAASNRVSETLHG